MIRSYLLGLKKFSKNTNTQWSMTSSMLFVTFHVNNLLTDYSIGLCKPLLTWEQQPWTYWNGCWYQLVLHFPQQLLGCPCKKPAWCDWQELNMELKLHKVQLNWLDIMALIRIEIIFSCIYRTFQVHNFTNLAGRVWD